MNNQDDLRDILADNGMESIEEIHEHMSEGGQIPSALAAYLETVIPKYIDTYRVVANAMENGFSIKDGQGDVYDITLSDPVATLDTYCTALEANWLNRLAIGFVVRIPGIGSIGVDLQDGVPVGKYYPGRPLGRKTKVYDNAQVQADVCVTYGGLRNSGDDKYRNLSPVDSTPEDWELFTKAIAQNHLPVIKNVYRNSKGLDLGRLGTLIRHSSNYTEFKLSGELSDLYANYQAMAPDHLRV